MGDAMSGEHVPDPSKLNSSVGNWQPMGSREEWFDGTQLLVALPISDRIPSTRKRSEDQWHYEYHVVVIRCDEDYFHIETQGGDSWDWSLSDCDFFIVMSE